MTHDPKAPAAITSEELADMKKRLAAYRHEMDTEQPNLGPLITSMAEMLAVDLPRCIAEIERLRAEARELEDARHCPEFDSSGFRL